MICSSGVLAVLARVKGMPAFAAAFASSVSAQYQEPGRPGQADHHGHIDGLAEQFRFRVPSRRVVEDARAQLDPFQRRAVVAQGHIVFRAPVDIVEQPLGQPAFRHLAEVFDVQGFTR